MILAVLHTHLSQKRIFIFCTVSHSFPPCLTLFFPPLSCVNPSRCSTGSATTKSCSCRVTQRSVWATSTPWTCRHSTTTLPWIPWWVEGTLWAAQEGGEGQHRSHLHAQGTRDLWEVMKGRPGCLWQQQCCSVQPDSDVWYPPWLKSSTALWSLFTFWRANRIFFKFSTFLWLGINESYRMHFNNLYFSLHTLLRYFSKAWKGDTNQAVGCGHSGILPFSVVNWSELWNATQFTFLFQKRKKSSLYFYKCFAPFLILSRHKVFV